MLQFWYYVSDVSLLEGNNQVEIGSAGKADSDEYSWSLNGLVSGWNYIELNTSEAGKIGAPDLSAINWFRLYRFKTGSVTTRIDAIQLIGENSLAIQKTENQNTCTIYPNPASDKVYIDFSLSKPSTIGIRVVNMHGQVILQKNDHQKLTVGNHVHEISVGHLKPGVYFVRIKIDDGVMIKKIIIE